MEKAIYLADLTIKYVNNLNFNMMKKLIIFISLISFSFVGFSQSCFLMLDTDADGMLSEEEYEILDGSDLDIGIKPSFNSLDSDGDGMLSGTEFDAAGNCIWVNSGSGSGGSGGSGGGSGGSGGSGGGSGGGTTQDCLDGFNGIDVNGDGVLTLAELQAGFPNFTEQQFAMADFNADGVLSSSELTMGCEGGLF